MDSSIFSFFIFITREYQDQSKSHCNGNNKYYPIISGNNHAIDHRQPGIDYQDQLAQKKCNYEKP